VKDLLLDFAVPKTVTLGERDHHSKQRMREGSKRHYTKDGPERTIDTKETKSDKAVVPKKGIERAKKSSADQTYRSAYPFR